MVETCWNQFKDERDGTHSCPICHAQQERVTALLAQVETAERQRDKLAIVLGRLADCIIEDGHGFRLDRYDQVCVAMNDAENALASGKLGSRYPPAKEAT